MGLLMLIFGLLCLYAMQMFTPIFDKNWLASPEFAAREMSFKIPYMFIVGFVIRFKFYTAFYLVQSSIDASGLSYSEDGKWNRVEMLGRWAELAGNVRYGYEVIYLYMRKGI